MIKLKNILNESSPGFENRKFGDALKVMSNYAMGEYKKSKRSWKSIFTELN